MLHFEYPYIILHNYVKIKRLIYLYIIDIILNMASSVNIHPFSSIEDQAKFNDLKNKYVKNFKENQIYGSLKDLQVQRTKEKMFGVFAKKNFDKGELIEYSPIYFLNFRSKYHGDPVLHYRSFPINKYCKCDECKKHGYTLGVPSGYISAYQVVENPNSVWYESPGDFLILIIALKDIKRGEQITIWKNLEKNNNFIENQENQKIDFDNFDWSKIPLTPTD